MVNRRRILAAVFFASITPTRFASSQSVITRVPGPLPACQPDNDSCVGDPFRGEMGISNDGRYIVYESRATNLVPGMPGVIPRIYIFDTTTQRTICATPSANGPAVDPSISADGRFVVFASTATNLVSSGSNGLVNIFLIDRDPDGNGVFDESPYAYEQISVDSKGNQANGDSAAPSISDDGTRVAFLSSASNLVANDSNSAWDAFLRDRSAGTTTRVDVSTAGAEALVGCFECDLSGDGQTVVFASNSNNLVAGDNNNATDVFLRDLVAGTTSRISFGINGQESNGGSALIQHSVSQDGSRVAFSSNASNLDARDSRGGLDVFLYDRNQSTITMVDFNSSGVQADGDCAAATISADGTKVAFSGWADNLASGDANYVNDVFVRDTVAGTTTCLSAGSAGGTGDGESDFAVLNGDGTKSAFSSFADNIVDNGWRGGFRSVYFADLGAATVQYVSAVPAGETNGYSYALRPFRSMQSTLSCSADGRWIVFETQATNLLPYDMNGAADVFVCDRTTGAVHCMSLNLNGVPAGGASGSPVISDDGRYVAFNSNARDLVANDLNGTIEDVFRVDRDPDGNGIFDEGNDVTILVSVDSNGNQGNDISDSPTISADGNRIAFASHATNLSPIDTNGSWDVFVRDVAAGTTTLLSERAGVCGSKDSWAPTISGNGEFIAFYTRATELGATGDYGVMADFIVRTVDDAALYYATDFFDTVEFPLVGPHSFSFDGSKLAWIDWTFWYNAGVPTGVSILQLFNFSQPLDSAYLYLGTDALTAPAIDANGDEITFCADKGDLVSNDYNGTWDQFFVDVDYDPTGYIHDLRPVRLVSMDANGNPANGWSIGGGMSPDGNLVTFASSATDLVAGVNNGVQNVFVLDRSKSARWLNYGPGFGWPSYSMPLTVDADPVLGTTITFQLANLSGTPTSAILILSPNPADVQVSWGATFMVDLTGALIFTVPLAAGGGTLQGTLPDDDSLAGVHLYFQSLQPDPSVPHRLAFTPGLELQLGR